MKIDAESSTNAITIEQDGQSFVLMGDSEDFDSGYLLELFYSWLNPEIQLED